MLGCLHGFFLIVHRISTEWFGLQETLKTVSFQPPPYMGRDILH